MSVFWLCKLLKVCLNVRCLLFVRTLVRSLVRWLVVGDDVDIMPLLLLLVFSPWLSLLVMVTVLLLLLLLIPLV